MSRKRTLVILALASTLSACSRQPGNSLQRAVDLIDAFPAAAVLHEQNLIDLGTREGRDFLTEGWSWNESSKSGGTYVWSTRASSKISFFLTRPRSIPLRFRALPYRCPTCEPQSISVRANGVGVDEVVLTSRWADYDVEIPSQVLKSGLNDLSFHYQWTVQPSEVSNSKETRRLAVAWDWIELGDGPNVRPEVDREAGILELSSGAQVDYFLDLPSGSMLFIDSLQSQQPSSEPLEISVLRGSEEEPELTRLTNTTNTVSLPLGDTGGLTRLRFRTTGATGDQEGSQYLLRRPRVMAPPVDLPGPADSPTMSATHAGFSDRPNVIFYVIDTLRADHLGSYGYADARTPNLADFATESVLFENAIAQSSWTKPSTASLLTGLLPWEHQANRGKDRLSDDLLTLPELLHATGYRTGGVVNNPNASGLFGFDQGFEHFVYLDDWRYPARTHHAEALEWLDTLASGDAPFFLYIHVLEPHGPYDPPREYLPEGVKAVSDPYAGSIGKRQQLARAGRPPTEQEVHDLIGLYDAEISFVDAQFAEFVQSLEERGLFDDSLFVLLSDHGEEFYDHGNWDHGRSLYSEVVGVPLVIRFPAATARSSRISVPVQQIDLMPTLMDVLALEGAGDLPGHSLLPLVFNNGEEDTRQSEFMTRKIFSHVEYVTPTTVSVVSGDWKLVVTRPRALRYAAELFDRRQDPQEARDVADEHPLVVGYLTAAIRHEMNVAAHRGEPETVELDEETRERLQALGYLN